MKTVFFWVIFALVISIPSVEADTLEYSGEAFSNTQGSLTNADRVFGSVTFSEFGDLTATGVNLYATLQGNPVVLFDVPDFGNLPDQFVISNNRFSDWENGVPTNWEFTIQGDVFGDSDLEQITIGLIGDVVAIDPGGLNGSAGLNFVAGTWTAVPEPSSIAILAFAMHITVLRRKRCLRKS